MSSKVSLVYRVTSRIAKVTQRNPVSKNKKQTNKKVSPLRKNLMLLLRDVGSQVGPGPGGSHISGVPSRDESGPVAGQKSLGKSIFF